MPNRERRTALARDVDVQRSNFRRVDMSNPSFGNPCMMAGCKDAAPARLLEPQQGAMTARVLEPHHLRKPTNRLRSLAAIDIRRSLAPIPLRRSLAAIDIRRSLAPIPLRRRLAPIALRRTIALRRRVAPMPLLAAPIVLPALRRRCLPTATDHHHAALLCRRFSYDLLHLFRRRRRGATLAGLRGTTALLGRRPAYPGCALFAVAAPPSASNDGGRILPVPGTASLWLPLPHSGAQSSAEAAYSPCEATPLARRSFLHVTA